MSDNKLQQSHGAVSARAKKESCGEISYRLMLPLIAIGLIVLLGFQCWWMSMSVNGVKAVAWVNPDATLETTDVPVVPIVPVVEPEEPAVVAPEEPASTPEEPASTPEEPASEPEAEASTE